MTTTAPNETEDDGDEVQAAESAETELRSDSAADSRSSFAFAHPPSTLPNWRMRVLVGGLCLFWAALAVRLVDLQWVRRQKLAERATRQSSYLETIPARPGEIVDRHGRLLATSVSVRSVYVVPSRISNPWQTAWSLADALGLDADTLYERLSAASDKHFLWVKRRITDADADRIRELKLPSNAWGFREEFLRRYPQGETACHVLGLRDVDGKGQGGLEQMLDTTLRGADGRRVLVRDARGRVVEVKDEVEQAPQHGRTVVLALDAVLQVYAERELDQLMSEKKALGATAIVMDPKTGELLAVASRPGFDPNDPARIPAAAWRNLAVTAVFEPGSTFKPFVVAWGLDKGLIRRDEKFDCENGLYRMGGRELHDHHKYGALSLTDVLVKSSNIGMAKIGERLGNDELYDATLGWGFGARTGVELPGELAGIVHPRKKWTSYSTGSVPMGQEIAVTPMQLLAAHAALANGGLLKTPRLVLRRQEAGITASEGYVSRSSEADTHVVSRVCTAETAQWLIREPMTQVVERGTGKKAKSRNYTLFGKTGTAQKLDPETGTYSHSKYIASFVCGAPADDPRALVLVMVDEPRDEGTGFGGDVAAPAAGRLLQKALLHLHVPGAAVRTVPERH